MINQYNEYTNHPRAEEPWDTPTNVFQSQSYNNGEILYIQEPLKVEIKTQPGDSNRDTVLLYIPLSKTGSYKSLLKFITVLKKIMKGQNLNNGPLCYYMTKKILDVYSL